MASFFTLFMIHTLHGTLIDAALGMTIFTLAAIIVSIGFGRLYTRYSSKKLLIMALTAFGLLGLTGTVIHSVALAFALLFVAGIFWGGIQVVSYPWGSELLSQGLPKGEDPADYYGLLFGMVNVTLSGGLLIAAPVAGLMIALDHGSYSAMFWVNVIASTIGVAALAMIRPQTEPTPR